MKHGIEHFFYERARCGRRVASLAAAFALLFLSGLGLATVPAIHGRFAKTQFMRFGFAGPKRVVTLVRMEAEPGSPEPMTDVGRVRPRSERSGGGGTGLGTPRAGKKPAEERARGPRLVDDGAGTHDLVRRALGQNAVPVFQSEELVIEKLVRPIYPEDARTRGIEGKVAVLALVDTLGRVSDAEVMTASGEPLLDSAAEHAVRQCVFRPFQQDGMTREVYAVFRFAFRIY